MQSKYVKTLINLLIYLVGIILAIYLIPRFVSFFLPFVIGWILACLANPLVRFLEKRLKIVRKHSSFVIIVGVLALLSVLLYFGCSILIREGSGFISTLPGLYESTIAEVQSLGNQLAGESSGLPENVRSWITDFMGNIGGSLEDLIARMGVPTVTAAGNMAKNIPNLLVYAIFTILSAYFFVAERDHIYGMLRRALPESVLNRYRWLRDLFSKAVGGYFKAQFKIMGVVAAILWVGLLILDVNYAILWAVLIAMLDFLPFLGTGFVLWPWALFEVLTGKYQMAAGLVIIYLVTQLVRQLIQPKIVGDSIGMDPLSTLICMFIGYRISSVFGMILAVPIGIIIINLYKSGAFDNLIEGVRQMVMEFNRYRRN